MNKEKKQNFISDSIFFSNPLLEFLKIYDNDIPEEVLIAANEFRLSKSYKCSFNDRYEII